MNYHLHVKPIPSSLMNLYVKNVIFFIHVQFLIGHKEYGV